MRNFVHHSECSEEAIAALQTAAWEQTACPIGVPVVKEMMNNDMNGRWKLLRRYANGQSTVTHFSGDLGTGPQERGLTWRTNWNPF